MTELTAKAGVLVMASHDPSTLMQHCNLGLRMEKGSVVGFGPIKTILAQESES